MGLFGKKAPKKAPPKVEPPPEQPQPQTSSDAAPQGDDDLFGGLNLSSSDLSNSMPPADDGGMDLFGGMEVNGSGAENNDIFGYLYIIYLVD